MLLKLLLLDEREKLFLLLLDLLLWDLLPDLLLATRVELLLDTDLLVEADLLVELLLMRVETDPLLEVRALNFDNVLFSDPTTLLVDRLDLLPFDFLPVVLLEDLLDDFAATLCIARLPD